MVVWFRSVQLLSSFILNLYLQVNKDFGSIFSTLLPGATAKLAPPQGCGVLDGLEFKVALGDTWKENLTELSGGQRLVNLHSFFSGLFLKQPMWKCMCLSLLSGHLWLCLSSWPCSFSNLLPSTSWMRLTQLWTCLTHRTLDRCCAHTSHTPRWGQLWRFELHSGVQKYPDPLMFIRFCSIATSCRPKSTI